MKFNINKTVFTKALSHIQNIVEKRNTIPILSNVKLLAKDNMIELSATDMDIALVEYLPTEVQIPGSITVPAYTLYDIVKKLPDDHQIIISYDESKTNNLKITSNNANFSLPVISADEFPNIESENMEHNFTLPRKDLLNLFDQAKVAISTEETRYYLNGIYFHDTKDSKGNDVIRAVATDGHRLARIEKKLVNGALNIPAIIIPRKTILEIIKILSESDDDKEVKISISKTKIRLEYGNAIILSKLIDGEFPDYEKVIPANNNLTLRTPIKSFVNAIDRVSTLSFDKGKTIKMTLNNNKLLLSADNSANGSAKEEISVDYNHTKIEIGFNYRYIMELTSVLDSDNIELFFADGSSPTLIQNAQNDSSLFVLMPVRV
jgi:DNA polymerase-3 subunit beta